MSGLSTVHVSSDAQLAVDAVGLASHPIRLTLPANVAALYRGKTLPLDCVAPTSVGERDESTRERASFYVLP